MTKHKLNTINSRSCGICSNPMIKINQDMTSKTYHCRKCGANEIVNIAICGDLF